MTSVRVVTFVLLRDLTSGKELAMYQELSPFIWKGEGPIWLTGRYISCFLVLQTIFFFKKLSASFFLKRDVIQIFQAQSCDGLVKTRARHTLSSMLPKPFFRHKVVMALQRHVQSIRFHPCCQNLFSGTKLWWFCKDTCKAYAFIHVAKTFFQAQSCDGLAKTRAKHTLSFMLPKPFRQGSSVHEPHHYVFSPSNSTTSRLLSTNVTPNTLLPDVSI